MRILFLTLYPETAASPRYRVAQFLPHLRDEGIECTVASPLTADQFQQFTGPHKKHRPFWYHLHETKNRLRQLLTTRHYDVLFVQKALLTAYVRGFPALLERFPGKTIYDIDDAVHLAAPHTLRKPWSLLVDPKQITKIVQLADLVLAGNHWLEEELQPLRTRTEYFPTVVDTERFTPPNTGNRPNDSIYRVGWIGSPSTTPQLCSIEDMLKTLRGTEILLVGADPKQIQCETATFLPWSYESEVQTVQQFSVGLMPQQKDVWAQGKCALKALQYMACGVPCISTPYGAVHDIIHHNENGLLADSREEWEYAIENLRDPEIRRRLGDAARTFVEEKYSLQTAAPRLNTLLETLA